MCQYTPLQQASRITAWLDVLLLALTQVPTPPSHDTPTNTAVSKIRDHLLQERAKQQATPGAPLVTLGPYYRRLMCTLMRGEGDALADDTFCMSPVTPVDDAVLPVMRWGVNPGPATAHVTPLSGARPLLRLPIPGHVLKAAARERAAVSEPGV